MKPLFVTGLPKSGTTLIQRLLDGHPQLMVDDHESKFFSRFVPEISSSADLSERLELAEDVFFRKLGSSATKVRHEGWSFDAISAEFRSRIQETTALKDYLPAAIASIGHESGQVGEGRLYWVEKTPYYATPYRLMHQWYPDASLVQNTRDPRGNFAALVTKDLIDRRAVGWFAHTWVRESVRARQVTANRAGPHLSITYEDLVTDPESTLSAIVEHLGIDDTESLRRPTMGGGDRLWGGNSAFGSEFTGISQDSKDRWKTVLEPDEIAAIERVAAGEMAEYGYEPTDVGTAPSSGALRRDFLTIEGRRYASMARRRPRSLVRRMRYRIR